MIILNEASRQTLLTQGKQGQNYKDQSKGKNRYERRLKSKVASQVKQFNRLNTDKLFKQGILDLEIEVKGETDIYYVKISYGQFLDILQKKIEQNSDILDLKTITRALITGFNQDDVLVHCSCPDFNYRFSYWLTKKEINSGQPENRPSNITNPDDKLGSGCKHILLVLSNSSWVIKIATTIYNYINWMKKNRERLYQTVIYPAIYGHEYTDDQQLSVFDDENELDSDRNTIDAANTHQGRDASGRFISGNKYQYKPNTNDNNQLSADLDNEGDK